MKKQTRFLALFLAVCITAMFFLPVLAQNEGYQLVLKREWGVGMPGAVQGHMSLNLKGELEAVQTVTYVIDDKEMAQMTVPDIKFRFNTDDYPSGQHKLQALITLKDGSNSQSNLITIKFLAKDEAGNVTRNIFVGIGVLTVLIVLLTFAVSKWQNKKYQQSDRAVTGSGLYGAAVCPKCGQAFTRTIIGLNLMTHRYEPCPHCGKWSMTQRATPAELETAQISEETPHESIVPQPDSLYNEEEQIDQSKYTEL